MAEPLRSFAPLAAPAARRLVLGTMPGQASLDAGEYYAHPRNAFWPIVEQLAGLPPGSAYRERTRALQRIDLAVWDVLAACHRASSLDSDIDPATARPNDFDDFLRRHPHIETIYFNGQPARRLFERLVAPSLVPQFAEIERVTLPSTSPTNARLTLADKRRAWAVLQTGSAA